MANQDKEKSIQDAVKAAQEQQQLGLTNFAKAANSAEYKAALGQIRSLKEPEAIKKGMQLVKDRKEDQAVRVLVLRKGFTAIGQNAEYIRDCLSTLQDPTEPIGVRKAVFSVLRVFNFGSRLFVSMRPEYAKVLRSLLDDPDASLREEAAEELAKHKDEYVQRRLLDGLAGRETPIINTAKAIQLLGYDIHAEHYPVVRKILSNPATDETTKVEAIHVLAGDPESRPLLIRMMLDKKQEKEVRMSSAVAVQSSSPKDFVEIAQPLVLDETEEKDVRAVCLNVLMHHRDANALYGNASFVQKINQLNQRTKSADLKKLSTTYLENATKHRKKQEQR